MVATLTGAAVVLGLTLAVAAVTGAAPIANFPARSVAAAVNACWASVFFLLFLRWSGVCPLAAFPTYLMCPALGVWRQEVTCPLGIDVHVAVYTVR